MHASNPEIQNFSFEVPKITNDELNLKIGFNLPNYGSISGNRIFFKPNLVNKYKYIPRNVSDRKSPVRFGYPYQDSDSISYSIPAGYMVEAVPSEVNLNYSFGSFSSKTYKVNDSLLVYTRVMKINTYIVPAKDYREYRKFFADVVKADRGQVVLLKK